MRWRRNEWLRDVKSTSGKHGHLLGDVVTLGALSIGRNERRYGVKAFSIDRRVCRLPMWLAWSEVVEDGERSVRQPSANPPVFITFFWRRTGKYNLPENAYGRAARLMRPARPSGDPNCYSAEMRRTAILITARSGDGYLRR